MLTLNLSSLSDGNGWACAGVRLPEYDVAAVRRAANEAPVWLHFGAGNIFRGFIARLQHELLNKGLADKGVIAADTFDFEIIDRIYDSFDDLTLMVDLSADGSVGKEVVASVTEAIKADGSSASMERLKEIFAAETLQMVSFTITEKGYALRSITGELLPAARHDMENRPEEAMHAMGIVCALLYHRWKSGGQPIALCSMDNCSHNGEKLCESVTAIAKAWTDAGFIETGFMDYVTDPGKVSFPWSMIDKITPRPAAVVEKLLTDDGIDGMSPITTAKGTYIAPFVNAEIPQYLVIEDVFPNGRPLLEMAGVYMTDRDTVNRTERMKVCTCLNPLHTALAVFGCLLGYKSIASEMSDPELYELVRRIGYTEGMPVVTDPGIIKPSDFLAEVIEHRLPNAFIPDTPQRIACDTSQKIPIRFGETIKAYIESDSLDVTTLQAIPLAIAGWLRYLLGVDDALEPMPISSDPMLPELKKQLDGISVGCTEINSAQLDAILSNKQLFGADLCECGLAEKIKSMLRSMLEGRGAVRRTLKSHLAY